MPLSAQIQVHKARERDAISIPFEFFIDSRGSVKFDKAINRGLVEVRQGLTGLVLKIGGVVGRLPLNEKHALDISPKFSMGNLSRIIALSDHTFSKQAEISRLYEITEPDGFLPELLLKSFCRALLHTQIEGRHRQYQKRTAMTSIRPRVNFQKSAQTLWSKGQMTNAVTDQFWFSDDNVENQILKHGCLIGHALCKSDHNLSKERNVFGRTLAEFKSVSLNSAQQLLSAYDPSFSTLPSFKTEHRKAVQIAIELIKRSGISYERFDSGLELPSFLIELDTVFESYVRNTLRSGLRALDTTISVGDGNLSQWQKPLFDDTNRGLAKPDILIKRSGAEAPLLVGDVKYKRDDKIGAADRYQVISHALAHRCGTALIVSPARHNQASSMIRFGKIGGEENGIDLYHFTMNMSAKLEDAELEFVQQIHALII